ncbi:protein phosphatase methylesterase 1-like [Ptychodera flava]|uniref:protein phosphatase methylesterase 1-like n=1 Tax=Ptychodera flava TaxID=63121 RepID=UPI00396A54EF
MALHKKVHLKNMAGKLPPMPPMAVSGGRSHGLRRKRDYTPVTWDHYFEKVEDVKVEDNSFRVYECGTEGPVIYLLHGGGHSSLSWAVLSKDILKIVKCRILAIDFRGHGDTHTTDDEDLSADTLSSDLAKVLNQFYGDEVPPVILVGHSMGGAIAVHTGVKNLIPSLIGMVVIDVVEGTALDALHSMQNFLSSRPRQFKSLENAIEWSMKSGQIRNLESAKVSMIGQLKRVGANETLSTSEVPASEGHNLATAGNAILEESEESEQSENTSEENSTDTQQQKKHKPADEDDTTPTYTWRIDLAKTEKHWLGWFQGLSSLFLSCHIPKMLLLAGVDRLDRELTIGQMQGKFQMQVLPQCGHAVHEDAPDKVAEALAAFMVRHKFAEPTADFRRPMPAC